MGVCAGSRSLEHCKVSQQARQGISIIAGVALMLKVSHPNRHSESAVLTQGSGGAITPMKYDRSSSRLSEEDVMKAGGRMTARGWSVFNDNKLLRTTCTTRMSVAVGETAGQLRD